MICGFGPSSFYLPFISCPVSLLSSPPAMSLSGPASPLHASECHCVQLCRSLRSSVQRSLCATFEKGRSFQSDLFDSPDSHCLTFCAVRVLPSEWNLNLTSTQRSSDHFDSITSARWLHIRESCPHVPSSVTLERKGGRKEEREERGVSEGRTPLVNF